jgi:hypothetical protein
MYRQHGTTVRWHPDKIASNCLGHGRGDTAGIVREARAGNVWGNNSAIGGKPFWNCGRCDQVHQKRAKASDLFTPSLSFLEIGAAPQEQGAKSAAGGPIETDLLDGELRGYTFRVKKLLVGRIKFHASLHDISWVEQYRPSQKLREEL